jgi:hypothetical protein
MTAMQQLALVASDDDLDCQQSMHVHLQVNHAGNVTQIFLDQSPRDTSD